MLVALLPFVSHAWVVEEDSEGHPLVWTTFPVEWQLDPTDAPFEEDELTVLMEEGFAAWEVPDTAVAFAQGSGTGNGTAADDGVNSIWFDTDWQDAPLLAKTTLWARISSNGDVEVFDFDLAFDAEVAWSLDDGVTGFDLLSTITHEAGHALGLGHSEVVESTMYSDALPGETHKRTLHDDDIDAIRTLYPILEDDTGTDDPPGFCACSQGGSSGWIGVLPALLVVCRRR